MLTIAGGIIIAFIALGALGALLALFCHPEAWVVLFILTVVGLAALVPGVGETIFTLVVAAAFIIIPVEIIRFILRSLWSLANR